MAISLRGTASATASGGANVTVTLPGATAENDVVFAAYAHASGTDEDLSTVTAGYTELADLFSNDNFDVQLGVYRKVQGVTPDSTVEFSVGGGGTTGAAGAVIVLIGVNTTTPEDATTTTATGIDDPVPDPPSITTVTNNAWVIAIGGSSEPDTSPTAPPSGYSNLVENQEATAAPISIMMATKLVAVAGAENPGVFGGIVGTTADCWCAATVAVRPFIPPSFPFMSTPFLPFLVR